LVRASDAHPTREAIETRAYELFLRRGRAHGDDWADWFAAEKELTHAPSKPAAKRARRAG
jgi:hypothetical protein